MTHLHHNSFSCSSLTCQGTSVVAKQGGGERGSPQLEQVGVRVGRVGVEGGGGGGGGQGSTVAPSPDHPQGLGGHIGGPAHPALEDSGGEPPHHTLHVGVGGPQSGALGTLWPLLRGKGKRQ